jgi:thiol-disulfide isomerase/thioredoxin
MNINNCILFLFSTLILLSACEKDKVMTVNGSIDYIGDATISVSKEPLHYKYSPKTIHEISSLKNGAFNVEIPAEFGQKLTFKIDDRTFLLIADPEDDPILGINRASFPLEINVESIHSKDYEAYQNYLVETDGLDKRIEKEMNDFKAGLENSAINLSEQKIRISEKHLKGTLFDHLILKAKGELLVNKIKSVEYRLGQADFNPNSERKKILEQARSDGFFTLESLEAQRAGIRDVTHYYSRTFGIYDSVNKALDKELAEYDIKRIAYEELNEKRLQVVEYIEDRKARAYAKMFLVAERIGEIELSKAEPSYRSYLEEYSEFEEYTNFLTYFYNEIKSVSPGEPAKPFSLKDEKGNTHTLKDYKGKYVLLDFWAGWCQPCLDEFPVMRDIYNDFSREDFEIIGISTEIDKDVWRTDIEKFENPWPQLYGGNGFDQETFKAYKGGGIPFYILVDPDGNIARYNDIRATFNLREVLNNLIDE